MKLLVFRSLWGTEVFSGNIGDTIAEIKRLGYDGIEASLGDVAKIGKDTFVKLLKQHDLKHICGIYTSFQDYEGEWEDLPVSTHVTRFREQLAEAVSHSPFGINAHSGTDSWTREECEEYFAQATAIEREFGVAVGHETHRSRALFNPWIAAHLVKKFDGLKLTADYSHWVVVAERLLTHPRDVELFSALADRVLHVHARVGQPQHAQVDDPELPYNAPYVDAHYRWWQLVWEAQRKKGAKYSTATPEYGPAPYTPTLPHSEMPVTNVWNVTNQERLRLLSRFEQWKSGGNVQ